MPEGPLEATLQSIAVEDELEGVIAIKWVVKNGRKYPINGRPYYAFDPGAGAPTFVPPMLVQTTTSEEAVVTNTFTVNPEWPTTFVFRVRVAGDWSGRMTPRFLWETQPQELVSGRQYSVRRKDGRLSISIDG
jgi:hypothetical protein